MFNINTILHNGKIVFWSIKSHSKEAFYCYKLYYSLECFCDIYIPLENQMVITGLPKKCVDLTSYSILMLNFLNLPFYF